jgi:hypothetical protein
MHMMCFILLNNINEMVYGFHKLDIIINKSEKFFLIVLDRRYRVAFWHFLKSVLNKIQNVKKSDETFRT